MIQNSADFFDFAKKVSRRPGIVTLRRIGRSVMGRPLCALTVGRGKRALLVNAAHHANEYITTSLIAGFIREYARAVRDNGRLGDIKARELFFSSRLVFVPLVNPDGADLVTGALRSGVFYNAAEAIAEKWPEIPFPDGWKANILGVDLNLQYPALWERAREIKGRAGFASPAPRDWPGEGPLSEPESRALYYFTKKIKPALTLSFHTQGEVIYWKYLDREPPLSREIAERLARVSGYEMEETPYASGFAGYKDWFISKYDLPGYTIEAGSGTSPLPAEQFEKMYEACRNIIVEAARVLLPD